ncbi:MAG: BamA/TamA family outer membrane protein [Acidobacteriales bacterium]|nr:BamA/TamA family outer membrane protein [Terriglobales bacterium]
MRLRCVWALVFVGVLSSVFALHPRADGATDGMLQDSSSDATDQMPDIPPLGGPNSYVGLAVAEIRFPNVVTEKDQAWLRQVISQRIGEGLRRDLVSESIKRLYATGRFADIQVEVDYLDSTHLILSFITIPRYFVGQVVVEGTPSRPTVSQILNASKLQLGEPFSQQTLDHSLESIKQLMEQHGYYRSSTSEHETKDLTTQQIAVTFHIIPGPQAHIGSIHVTGNGQFSVGQIEDIADLHPGDLVSVQRLTAALDHLRKKYQKQNRWLAQVTIAAHSYRSEANAVDYVLQVDPGPTVDISVDGFKISARVLKRNVPIFEENAIDDDLLNEGRRNLLNYMQSRGYFDAKVSFDRKPGDARREVHVVYAIAPGPRHKVVKLEISGNRYFREDLLRARMQVQPSSRVFSQGRYNQSLLADDIQGLEDLYHSNGFQQVKITSVVQDDYQGQENQLAIKVVVDEGPQTLVGEFRLAGNNTFSEEQLRPYINTAKGQLFSQYNIAQDRENLLNFYFNRGFPNASFDSTADELPGNPKSMSVIYTIHEGNEVFVDQVLVSGLNFTRPYVVNRELEVKPGDALSHIDMLKTQQRLYDLGIFSQVDTAIQNPEGIEPKKNVLVQVQEARRYTFTYGIGLEFQTGQPNVGSNQPAGATGVSPRVSLDITRLNFRGRDHTLTFSAHVGRLQQRGLVSYAAPRWFNIRSLRFSVAGFYDNTVDVATFTSQRLEGYIQAEQTLSRASTMDYRFTFRRVKASNPNISILQAPLLSLPVRVGEPEFTYIRDKRDNALESSKGSYNTVNGGVAAGFFGSEADFSRLLIQNSTYYSFGKNRPAGKKFVLARSTRIGIENPFANTVDIAPGQAVPAGKTLIPLPERFFSGGGNSHRGFGLNQAGPRDPQTGFPLGGSALFLNNLELRLPPVNLPFFQDNLSFAIFHDAGNVFTNGHDMLHSLLRWHQAATTCVQASTAMQCNYNYISHAIGLGVRYKTPIGPVRFDFGYNLNPPVFPTFQTVPNASNPASPTLVFGGPQHLSHFNVYFSIGQTF